MEKKLSMEELKQGLDLDAAAGVEIPDDLLDTVAGGAITLEEWNKLSKEEQDKLRMESLLFINKGMPCSLL